MMEIVVFNWLLYIVRWHGTGGEVMKTSILALVLVSIRSDKLAKEGCYVELGSKNDKYAI